MKRSHKTGAVVAATALAALSLGGMWAHAASNAPSDAGDQLKPQNSFAIGNSGKTVFKTLGGAITISCTHNVAIVKTPAANATGASVPLQILPPTFDNGVVTTSGSTFGNVNPCPVTLAGGGSGGTAKTVTSGAWNATAYDCPSVSISTSSGRSAGGTCSGTEAAETTQASSCTTTSTTACDIIVIHIPQNGAVVRTTQGCVIDVAPASTGYNVVARYKDTNPSSPTAGGQLLVSLGALPIKVTGTGCPITVTSSTFYADGVHSGSAPYNFNPKLLDN